DNLLQKTTYATGILGNDIPSSGLTAQLIGGVAHGTLTLQPDGTFSYMPDADYNGPDSFTYKASHGTDLSAETTVKITVTAVNDAPTALDVSATTGENTAITVEVLSNAKPGPDNESSQSLFVLSAGDPSSGTVAPNHGTVTINEDGTLTYTPDAGYHGDDSFTYTIQDTGTTNGRPDFKTVTKSVSVTVKYVNQAPVAQDGGFTIDEDAP